MELISIELHQGLDAIVTNKYKYIELYSDKEIKKYLKVRVGSKPWRSDFLACIEHHKISPIFEKWLAFPKKRGSADYPQMINVNLNCRELVDILYSDIGSPLDVAIAKAKELAIGKLAAINNEGDLLKILNTPEIEYDYMDNLSPKIIARSYINVSNNNMVVGDAIQEAETYFNYEIHKKDNLIKVLERDI